MKTILRIDAHIKRHMPLFVLLAMGLGLLLPKVFGVFLPWMTVMLAFLTFSNTLGGNFRGLGEVVRRPRPLIVAFLVLHLAMPTLALVLGRVLFPAQADFVNGLVLQFTLPVGVNTMMWVGMAGGDLPLCLAMVLLDTLLSPLSIPLSLQLLLGTSVEMDMSGMMKSLLIMVVIPAVLAMLLYEKDEGRKAGELKQMLQLPAKIVLMLLVAANGSKCAEFFSSGDPWLLLAILTVLMMTVVAYAVGYLVSGLLRMNFPSRLSVSVDIGYRNLSAGMVLAQQFFAAEALLPVALTPLFQNFLISLVTKMLWKTSAGKTWAEKEHE